jgi:hypothetical protein
MSDRYHEAFEDLEYKLDHIYNLVFGAVSCVGDRAQDGAVTQGLLLLAIDKVEEIKKQLAVIDDEFLRLSQLLVTPTDTIQ